jgi:hypothetical protein
MNISAHSIAKPKSSRLVLSVRILTWLALSLFIIVSCFAPHGITVSWDEYFMGFGPIILVDFAALTGFVVCRLKGRTISFMYPLISLGVIVGVWYVTWFELRLRWWKVFP